MGAAHQDNSNNNKEYSKIYTGIGNGISGAAMGSMIGGNALKFLGPWGAAIGAVGGFLISGIGAIVDGLKVTA